MTEAEWRASLQPVAMLEALGERVTSRKAYLTAAAFCRHFPYPRNSVGFAKVFAYLESFADQSPTEDQLNGLQRSLRALVGSWRAIPRELPGSWRDVARGLAEAIHLVLSPSPSWKCLADFCNRRAAAMVPWPYRDVAPTDQPEESYFLRCLFGSPFRPIAVHPPWQTATVLALASAAYKERQMPVGHLNLDRLAVLSDALEDAGCDDAEVLSHLRLPLPHVRGCWALDLILGKQ
jgi:hypothetical protein